MQSLAQTITICAVCTIYMKYIFIPDMCAHEIASLSLFPLSLLRLHSAFVLVWDVLFPESLSDENSGIIYVPFISYNDIYVAFCLPYFTHKCAWIAPCS